MAMDEYIKQSIEGRKNAIGVTYEVSVEMQEKIDALFGEIEKLGAKCKDVGDFEAQFAVSPLNQKYLDLFTEVATSSQAKVTAPKVDKSGIAKMVARAAVHQKAYDEVRKVPGLRNAIDVSEKVGYAMHLGKLFKKKKKD